MKSSATVTETYKLPSLGKLYGPDFPEEVTIRSMTTFEEKIRLGNQGFWKTMTSIINSVVVSPENFDANMLTLFDFQFLMYKMRTVSYGSIYRVSVTCPNCGKQVISKVNLDDLDVKYLDDSAMEPFEITLPRSKDTIQCRHLRVYDTINNDKKAKEILKSRPEYEGDPNYILNIVSQIASINGETMVPPQIQLYVEKMMAMDSAYFFQAYNKITGDLGLNTICHETCDHCGEEIEFLLPFNSEFFRPTFDF